MYPFFYLSRFLVWTFTRFYGTILSTFELLKKGTIYYFESTNFNMAISNLFEFCLFSSLIRDTIHSSSSFIINLKFIFKKSSYRNFVLYFLHYTNVCITIPLLVFYIIFLFSFDVPQICLRIFAFWSPLFSQPIFLNKLTK